MQKSIVVDKCASHIQRCIRRHDLVQSNERIQKISRDIIYQERVIEKLSRKLAADETWRELLLGAEDNEVAASISDADRMHVTVKARHIIDALL